MMDSISQLSLPDLRVANPLYLRDAKDGTKTGVALTVAGNEDVLAGLLRLRFFQKGRWWNEIICDPLRRLPSPGPIG